MWCKFIETESKTVVSRGWGRGSWAGNVEGMQNFGLGVWKISGDEQWWWLESHVNLRSATELYTNIPEKWYKFYVTYILPQYIFLKATLENAHFMDGILFMEATRGSTMLHSGCPSIYSPVTLRRLSSEIYSWTNLGNTLSPTTG